MAFTNSPIPVLQFLDGNGVPLSGGLLYSWAAGQIGTTALATYSDSIGTLNSNPVVLDAAGRAVVYLGAVSYGFQLRTALGVLVWTQDHVDPTVSPASGNLTLAGALTVAGNTTLSGNLGVALSTTLSGNLAVALNATITGNLSVAGTIGGTGVQATAYTPIWAASGSAASIGNGSLAGSCVQIGQVVLVSIELLAGSTTNFGSGTYIFSLPKFIPTSALVAGAFGGSWTMYDLSATAIYGGIFRTFPSIAGGSIQPVYHDAGNDGKMILLGATAPVTLATGDVISVNASYLSV